MSPTDVRPTQVFQAQPTVKPEHDGFYRTPFQIALLSFATLNTYSVYYVIRGLRLAERRMGQRERSYWFALWLIVPGLNIAYFYGSFNRICERVRTSGVNPPVNFGLQALAMNVVDLLWRLPDPYWLISLLSSILLGTIHMSVAQAERLDEPEYVWPPLNWFEWLLIVLGFAFLSLGMIGTAMTDATSAYFALAIVLAMGAPLPYFYVASRRFRPVVVVTSPNQQSVNAGSGEQGGFDINVVFTILVCGAVFIVQSWPPT